MLVARHVRYGRLHVIEHLWSIIHNLKDNLTLFAGTQNAVMTNINQADIADFQLCMASHVMARLHTRLSRRSSWITTLAVTGTGTVKIDPVIATIRSIKAAFVNRTVIIVISIRPVGTLPMVLLYPLSLFLVSSSTNGSTHGSTTGHADYRADITSAPASGDTTDGRTQN